MTSESNFNQGNNFSLAAALRLEKRRSVFTCAFYMQRGAIMAKEPEPTSEAAKQAAELQEEIERLKKGETDPNRPMSPREFIRKRMAELDKKKGK